MIRVVRIPASEWSKFSEAAHLAVFHKHKPKEMDRIDFALTIEEEETSKLIGYITCREMDSETVYWQFGGAFPGTIKTSVSWVGYLKALRWTEEKYLRIATVVENDNYVMLKFHLKSGFKITGFRVFKSHGLVELTKEVRVGA